LNATCSLTREDTETLGWAFESLVGLVGASPETYARRYAVPMIETADFDSKTAIMFSDKVKVIKSRGWVAVEANRESVWMQSEDIVKRKS